MHRVLVIFGTRPEAIKMGPVITALEASGDFHVIKLATAQHREMLDEVLRVFEIRPDYDLDVMSENQRLVDVTQRCLAGIDRIMAKERPNFTVAQGDTTTVLAGALAAYYNRIPFGHVEAGLRTHDRFSPYPEEINRRIADSLSDLHFAPTEGARDNLLREGVSADSIHVCGNTVVDAIRLIAMNESPATSLPEEITALLARVRKPLLVTAHRRESFGAPMESICRALSDIVRANSDVGLVFPMHPNPNVRRIVGATLSGHERILLCEPVDYLQFVRLMQESYLILTDSGGVQEEAPSLAKPVLVLRDKTERPEGIAAGVARLVGTNSDRIIQETRRLLESKDEYHRMVGARNPYGDGFAGRRIAGIIQTYLGVSR